MTGVPTRKELTLCTVVFMMRFRASSAAHAICGVMMQLRAVSKRIVFRRRFAGENVECGAGNFAAVESGGEVAFVDECTACRVDEKR